MNHQSILRTLAVTVSMSLLVIGVARAAVDERPRPSLSVEKKNGTSRMCVDVVRADGTTERRVVHETSADARPLDSGWEPSGRAGFVTWEESGNPWFSYSRDGGANWSKASPLSRVLRLHDGDVAPLNRMPEAPESLKLPSDGGLYLVQLKTISLPEWREALERAGAKVLAYVPDNAHVVRLGPASAARVEALAGLDIVERVEPYHPWYRLSSELRTWLNSPAEAAAESKRVRVSAFEWGPAGKGRIAALAKSVGVEIVEQPESGHIIELNVNREQLARIAAHDDVEWIDPWVPPQVTMDLVRQDSGADWLESNYFSVENDLGYCGQGVRGEVMDSGIWEGHPDFDPILFHGPHSVDSHGTSTYGIVFGQGRGDARARGLLPCGEGIYAMWNPPDRYAHTAQLKQAPYFASFQTNSWGNYDAEENQYTSLSAQMDDIIWKLDIAILNGQGNFGTFGSLGQAIAKNIISVGGIAHHDTLSTSDDTWAVTGFRDPASIGPAQDGRVKPDISYWYDAIYTTDAEPGGYSAGLYTFPPNFAGTSAATPESAGVLGLMLQMWKENVWGTNHPPEMTVFEAQPHFSTLKALLINNAQQYPFSGEGHDLSRYHQGWGRPSVRIAKERAARSFIVNQSVLLEVGELATYRINVASGEPELKVTMVYPDPPGNPASSIARVNDLDLRVISPSGVVYHGNVGLISGNASVPGGAANRIDTVENVFVVSPETGTWTVAVEAAEINEDACPVGHPSTCGPTPGGTPEADATFSLVVTGGTGGSACTAPTANITAAPNPVRVGQAVQFQGNASGGAGGPYSYWWDVDGDGAPDSTVADAVHTYPRPFAGSVSLWVADAANCPVTVHETVTVTGPDLRYDSHVGLTEVEGNGNGGIDPGETWELTVNLRNDGSEPALGVSADLMSDPGSAVPVTFLQASSTYADIPVGAARTSARAYRFRVDSPAPCGEWISFGLVARLADPAYSYPTEAGVIRLLVGATGPAMTIFYDDFEQLTNWGWPGDEHGNDCEIDIPRGLGGPLPDPSGGYDGPHVLGNDLTGVGFVPGNYENDVFTHCISPVFDFSRFVHLSVSYARWLNVSYGDWAYLDLFHGLGQPNGTRQRVHTWSGTADSSWVVDSFDISDYADGRNPIRLSFEIMSDSQATSSGWNIDAFEVRGVPLESCEPYVPATGPDLRYDSHVALTEVDGNGNGGIDPGETWELTVKLRNVGNEPAVGVSADLVPDAGSLVSVTMLQAGSTYADIPVGATTLSDRAYRFRVDSSAPCGAWISIGLAARTTDPANSYPTQVGVIRLWVGGTGPAVTVFYDNFEGAPYLRQGSVTHPAWWWSEGEYSEWQIDTPRGLGGPMPDPNGGYDGPHVLGNDLTGLGVVHGNYETDGVFSSTVESITLDLSQYKELSLSLARWLNVGAGDRATFDVNNNTVFSSTDAADSSWKLEMFDISNFAVGGVSFRFNIDSDAQGTASGWNIDAFEVRGVPLDSCEPYVPDTTPPSVAITSPTENANVSGTVDVTVNASDNAGVARVDLYRDGTLIGTDSSSPYAISWNTTNETIGSHTLMAYAYDTSNLSTSSSPVHVNVSCNAVGATGLTVTKAGGTNVLLTWTAVSGATSFDVVRGGLSALRSTHGDFNTATQACSANNTTATSLTTSEGLTPGNGYWYLVRGSTCGAAGTYDDGTQVASRDAGINASGNRSCP